MSKTIIPLKAREIIDGTQKTLKLDNMEFLLSSNISNQTSTNISTHDSKWEKDEASIIPEEDW